MCLIYCCYCLGSSLSRAGVLLERLALLGSDTFRHCRACPLRPTPYTWSNPPLARVRAGSQRNQAEPPLSARTAYDVANSPTE